MHLPQTGVIKIKVLILVLQLLHELLATKMSPLLLRVVHITNQSLNLSCVQLLCVDVALSLCDLLRTQLTHALVCHCSVYSQNL